ncbi:autophagocytosis associated protein [Microdochium nivale]|nr:autophagocytosis associated protein [Microdochium nivale]
MDQASHHRAAYQSYPHLTPDEFAETCHYLDSKYCRATLGPFRRTWRLHVRAALGASSFFDLAGAGSDTATYLQITRPLTSTDSTADDDDLASCLGTFSFGHDGDDGGGVDAVSADDRMVEMDEADEAILPRHASSSSAARSGYVNYEIHYHPTYRAPCLWFALHDLPAHERAFDVETIFRRLVPSEYKDSMRRVGSIGGISADVST